METIVIGFDGTEPSFVALDWVARRATNKPCRVEIVRIDIGGRIAEEAEYLAFDEAERRLSVVAPGIEVSTRTVFGRLPDALLRAADEADMLVIGARRRRPLRTALTGWRPLRSVARSRVPTVVVPDDWAGVDGPILVGIDDDASSTAAVGFAAAEAAATGVDLLLLHAWHVPDPTMDGSVALLASPITEKATHRRILDGAASLAALRHPSLAIHKVLTQDSPAAALLSAAEKASLLVIGTHHRGVLAGAYIGSVAQDTVARSTCPVCVVPLPPDAA